MIEKSNIDEHLRQAYEQAEYYLPRLEIRIFAGKNSPEIDALLIDNNCYSACLITAHNPASEILPISSNADLQHQLIEIVEKEGFTSFEAYSKDPLEKWPEEVHAFILDCSLDNGKRLGKMFGQNAILHLELGQPTELVWIKT